MSHADDGLATAAAAAEEPTGADSERCLVDCEHTAAENAPPAGGEASSGPAAAPRVDSEAAGSNSIPRTEAALGPVQVKPKSVLDEIAALKAQQKEAREKKMQVTKELRNAEKRRQRLKRRAKQLTDVDLLAVVLLRNDEKALARNANNADHRPEEELAESETESNTAESVRGGASASASPCQSRRKRTRT